MNWVFLTDIARDIDIPIVQPYNYLFDQKDKFYDSYIKVGDVRVNFSKGFGLSYSSLIRTKYKDNSDMLIDLTDVCRRYAITNETLITTINYIYYLFVLGRTNYQKINIRKGRVNRYLNIPQAIVFPLLYLLDVLKATYHMESLLTYMLAHVYNRVFHDKFRGYSEDDRLNVRFFISLMITFEPSNPKIIYRFLRSNQHSRFGDLLWIIKDSLTNEYLDSVLPIIKRLLVANDDRYVILIEDDDTPNNFSSIQLVDKYYLADRRTPTLLPRSSFTDLDIPLVIFDDGFIGHPRRGRRVITSQMIQDRLPFDINRKDKVTIEGVITSVMLPIINKYFFSASKNLQAITFDVYYVERVRRNVEIIPITCSLDNVCLIVNRDDSIKTVLPSKHSVFDGDDMNQIYDEIVDTKTDRPLLKIKLLQFADLYPPEVESVNQTLKIKG